MFISAARTVLVYIFFCKDFGFGLPALFCPKNFTRFSYNVAGRWWGVEETKLFIKDAAFSLEKLGKCLGPNPTNLLWVFPLTLTHREQALLAGVESSLDLAWSERWPFLKYISVSLAILQTWSSKQVTDSYLKIAVINRAFTVLPGRVK